MVLVKSNHSAWKFFNIANITFFKKNSVLYQYANKSDDVSKNQNKKTRD